MADEPKKEGFWGKLFRAKSNAQGGKLANEQTRRASEGDALSRQRRVDGPERERERDRDRDYRSERRRRRRPTPRDSKGKGRAEPNRHEYEPTILSEWPPSGVSSEEELSLGHAMELISQGVPAHKGHKRPIPHRSEHYYALYTTTAGNRGEETDAANLHDSMTELMTLRIQGADPPTYPWETLEQPSLSFAFGGQPGTITLNHWACLSSQIPPNIELRDPGMVPREVDLADIFARLKELEKGLEENEDLRYRNLYKRLLRDADKGSNPHKSYDKQITDLIMILSRSDWIDFTVPKNQVVTKFIYETGHANHQQYVKFFHQLLLSLELDLRINSKIHIDTAKEKLMSSIPPRIQWNLALSRRWRDNVRVEEYGRTAGQVRLKFKLRKRQGKMLKRFAQMLKWPNLSQALDELRKRDADGSLVDISSHTMAFFSGLVLPGVCSL